MIVQVLTGAAGIVTGLLMGGCGRGGEEMSKQLLQRNAALETQVSAGQNTLTALAVTCVILAGGLGVTMVVNRRRRGKRNREA